MPVSKFQKISSLDICDGACFSKVGTCDSGLLLFLKQWGSVHLFISSKFSGNKTSMIEPILTKLQTAGFNTKSRSKIKF